MYFHAKRMELPWGVFRLQKTFRGYNVQAKPQHDGVAAVTATTLGCINGSERQELHLLILCVAETRTRPCSLNFHFWEGCSGASPASSCRKPLKVIEMKNLLFLALQKGRLRGDLVWSSQGTEVPSNKKLFNLVNKWCKTKAESESWNKTCELEM